MTVQYSERMAPMNGVCACLGMAAVNSDQIPRLEKFCCLCQVFLGHSSDLTCLGLDLSNIYVYGFPKNWNQSKLSSLFEAFGSVTSARLMTDRITGTLKNRHTRAFQTTCNVFLVQVTRKEVVLFEWVHLKKLRQLWWPSVILSTKAVASPAKLRMHVSDHCRSLLVSTRRILSICHDQH
jgi:hypothetical protein